VIALLYSNLVDSFKGLFRSDANIRGRTFASEYGLHVFRASVAKCRIAKNVEIEIVAVVITVVNDIAGQTHRPTLNASKG